MPQHCRIRRFARQTLVLLLSCLLVISGIPAKALAEIVDASDDPIVLDSSAPDDDAPELPLTVLDGDGTDVITTGEGDVQEGLDDPSGITTTRDDDTDSSGDPSLGIAPDEPSDPATELSEGNGAEEGEWPEAIALDAQDVDPTKYSYEVKPLLAPFNNLVYVKTNNPDPYSFRLIDKSSKYLDSSSSSDEPATFKVLEAKYLDVAYENESSYRVHGGYVFYDYSVLNDGGTLTLQKRNSNGTYSNTSITMSCPVLMDRVDWLIATYASGVSDFFAKMNAVDGGLVELAVYPHFIYDVNAVNENNPYPFLTTSPYPELTLNEQYEMYAYADNGMMLTASYPFVLDSLSFPSMLGRVAKRLDASAVVNSGTYHYEVSITYGGQTKYYGGAGLGSHDPVFSNRINTHFSFDGSSSDIATTATINELRELYLSYSSQATDDITACRDLIAGDTFVATVRPGAWLRVGTEPFWIVNNQTIVNTTYAYVAAGPDDGTVVASNAWVDGRYVNEYEQFESGARFADHPKADIIVRNMSYTEISGNRHRNDVIFKYSSETDTWRATYYYSGHWWYTSYMDRDLPSTFILTRAQVEAMELDKNTSVLPASGLIYDGTVEPGTPFQNVRVESVSLPTSVSIAVNEGVELTPTFQPSNTTDTRLKWKSSNESVAEVYDTGYVAGRSAGKATVTCTTVDGGKTASCTVYVRELITAEDYWLGEHAYTGNQVKPKPVVRGGSKTLKEGTDYTLSYSNNVNVGKATVNVTGKGNYAGTITCSFRIVVASIADASVTAETQTYTGSALRPDVTVKLGGRTLVSGTDYYVYSYANNVNVGTASVTVKGVGNYTGSATGSFTIKERPKVDISGATVVVADQTYTGSPIRPKVSLTLDGRTVPADGYTVAYASNTNAGTATVTATGAGDYAGTATGSFAIKPASIAAATVTAADQACTGSALRPAVTVRLGGRTLASGTDYTVSYANNTDVGTATVTVTGRGNYAGRATGSFLVCPPQGFFVDADPMDRANHGFEVDWLGRTGISTGWAVAAGREYRGMEDVARCDFAAFLYRMADMLDDGRRNDSSRLSGARVKAVVATLGDCDTGTPHVAEVAWLVDSGISRGWANGDGTVSFRPMAKVTRQDMAAFLYRFADLRDDNSLNGSLAKGGQAVAFSDVRHGDETNHAGEVEWLASVGITRGWEMADGTCQFRGTSTVRRQDMAAFMYRLYAYLS